MLVEVDEVLRFVSHIAAKVPSHDTVPSGIVLLHPPIKINIYLLYMSCNVLLNIIFLQGLSGIKINLKVSFSRCDLHRQCQQETDSAL
uniref:Uncharacterized protein n=1 Tax=Pelusios castaneus TaxID=367368 RepID=A0A8C8RGH9_9SAUR